MTANEVGRMAWWSISGEDLMDMLRRCATGEDPDMVYAEAYANSTIENVPPSEDGG
jgi:hypothetical protein